MNLASKILVVLALLAGFGASAQKIGALRGTVRDAETGEELPGAGVSIVGTYYSTVTDMQGGFVLPKVPVGEFSVKVQMMGYGTKQINGVRINLGQTTTLNVKLSSDINELQTVTVVGKKTAVDLERAGSERLIGNDELRQMNVRNVEDAVATQAGVVKTTDGLQIRGARVYETEYLVDGISAQDPLAGTGFGVNVQSSAVQSIQVTTSGASAEFGGGSSGVVSTQIREGGDQLEVSGRWQRDYLRRPTTASSFFTDRGEATLATPVPFTKKRLTFFTSASVDVSDTYFPTVARQLHSSLFKANDSLWAPRQDNQWSHSLKLGLKAWKGAKFTLSNQHSLNINQNTRSLQIVGLDALLTPGYQYIRSKDLDRATTYTHHSNLSVFGFQQIFGPKWGLSVNAGRLFTNLRADANGRPFREETVDQILDEANIISYPVSVFNPGDPSGTVYIRPGDGLYNNGGIAPTWHDHYVEEYTLRIKANYYPAGGVHKVAFGTENQWNEYQWVDVTAPWVGAPIKLNDSTATESISIGSSNDIWKARPREFGAFIEDKINYKGLQATLGMRLNMWAPGTFADQAIADPNSPVVDAVRTDYLDKTIGLAGLRWKARLLPRLDVTFPVTPNHVLYFNYGHSMRLPHPRFLYAGLDPVYQDRSFLSFLGNPNLDPEVNVAYEVGYKAAFSRSFGVTLSAYNSNRFDYIVSRRVFVRDATGRPVTKTMYINQDYARIQGVELGLEWQLNRWTRWVSNVSLQSARGKSNSARESALQIEQTGEVPLSREQFLAWDRPWNINSSWFFKADTSMRLFGIPLRGLGGFIQYRGSAGYRYTPQTLVGTNDLGRPQYAIQVDQYLQGQGTAWHTWDARITYDLVTKKKGRGVQFAFDVLNVLNRLNGQLINPVTGRAYEYGDDVPNTWRDPRPEFNGPQERGLDPRDPSRFSPPRQILFGLQFKL